MCVALVERPGHKFLLVVENACRIFSASDSLVTGSGPARSDGDDGLCCALLRRAGDSLGLLAASMLPSSVCLEVDQALLEQSLPARIALILRAIVAGQIVYHDQAICALCIHGLVHGIFFLLSLLPHGVDATSALLSNW